MNSTSPESSNSIDYYEMPKSSVFRLARKVELCNRIALGVTIVVLSGSIVFWHYDVKPLVVCLLIFACTYPFTLVLNKFANFDLAASYFIVTFNGGIFTASLLTDLTVDIQSYFAGAAALPFIFFENTQPKKIAIFVILPLLLFISVIIISTIFKSNILSEDQSRTLFYFGTSYAFGFNILFMLFFCVSNFNSEKRLERQNMHLKETLIELEKAQSKLVQKEKMATIGLLASGVAHQLGNTLNSISTATRSVETSIKKTSFNFGDISSAIDIIKQSLKLSTEIIRGLDYAAKKNVERESLALKQVVSTAMVLMSGKILEKVKIYNEISENIYVFASQSSLLQILMNLVSNSLDALENISNGQINFSAENHEEFVLMTYKDNGKGIPPEIIQKMFIPFETSKTADKGSGLGMYIVKEEIERNGGSISIESSSEGVKLYLKIPKGQIKSLLPRT